MNQVADSVRNSRLVVSKIINSSSGVCFFTSEHTVHIYIHKRIHALKLADDVVSKYKDE